MNKKMIGLSALAVLSLAACNKNVENGVEAHGNTQAGLVVTVQGGSSLRADDYSKSSHQVDADGKADEQTVSSLYVLMGKNQKTFGSGEFTKTSAALGDYSTTGTQSYMAGPWLVAAGANQNMAVVVNGTESPFNAYGVIGDEGDKGADKKYGQNGQAAADTYADNLNKQLKSLSTPNNFVMSSALETHTISPDVSKDDVQNALTAATGNSATSGEDIDKNVFHFNLERLVCKGIVATRESLRNEARDHDGLVAIEDGTGSVELSSLKYAAINGATQIYVLASHAGERTMTKNADGKTAAADGVLGEYKGYTSAIDASKIAPTSAAAMTENLVRLGNIGISALNGGKSGYAPIAVSVSAPEGSGTSVAETTEVPAKDGVYFLENSTSDPIADGGDKLTSYSETSNNNKAGYYRFAYAKVYAKVTPARLFYLDNSGTLKSGDAKTAGLAKDGTFYQGMDGQLYATVAAAKAAKQDRVFIYNKGMCFYRALWNREYKTSDMKKTSYVSTRRNNIYLISINSFKKLGMPFDPSDPNDPNLPAPGAKILGDDPKKPTVVVPALPEKSDGVTAVGVTYGEDGNETVDEEAVKKDDPRIDKTETYMAVTATVLKWNLVARVTDLE